MDVKLFSPFLYKPNFLPICTNVQIGKWLGNRIINIDLFIIAILFINII